MVIPVSKPKVSEEEQKYRENAFPDIKEIKKKNLLCTSCGRSLKELIAKGKPISHPFLETLLCEKCHEFYGDGEFSVDEDGSDKYCRWCGQGGTLFLCSQCTAGFCKRCVKRNLPRSALAEIEKDDWVCYCCNTAPLYELRAQCWAAIQYASEVQAKTSNSSSKSKKSGSKSKRSHDSSDEEERSKSMKRAKTNDSENEDETNIKKKSKDEHKKHDKKRDQSKDENGEKSERRSLRDRKSKTEIEEEEEEELPEGSISKSKINPVINKYNVYVTDSARLTKEAHKKMLEVKAKKLNYGHLNTPLSVADLGKRIIVLFDHMQETFGTMRDQLVEFIDDWNRTMLPEEDSAKLDLPNFLHSMHSKSKIKKKTVENGIIDDDLNKTKMDITEESSKPNDTAMIVDDSKDENNTLAVKKDVMDKESSEIIKSDTNVESSTKVDEKDTNDDGSNNAQTDEKDKISSKIAQDDAKNKTDNVDESETEKSKVANESTKENSSIAEAEVSSTDDSKSSKVEKSEENKKEGTEKEPIDSSKKPNSAEPCSSEDTAKEISKTEETSSTEKKDTEKS